MKTLCLKARRLVKSIFITLPLNIATNELLVGILVYGAPVYFLLIDFTRHIGRV